MGRFGRAAAFVVLLIGAAGAAKAQPAGAAAEEPELFPDHPGRDAAFYFCSACHGFKLVAAQGQTRAQWDGTLNLMTEKHSMPKVEGAARAALLDYLAAAFAPRQRPAGRQSPFAPN